MALSETLGWSLTVKILCVGLYAWAVLAVWQLQEVPAARVLYGVVACVQAVMHWACVPLAVQQAICRPPWLVCWLIWLSALAQCAVLALAGAWWLVGVVLCGLVASAVCVALASAPEAAHG